jgi:hypothetical protein
MELFRGPARCITVMTVLVCALALTAHWAFLFWYLQHLRNLPELAFWSAEEKTQLVSKVVWLVMLSSIGGNFLAALLARWLKYRRAIALLCLAYAVSMLATYSADHDYATLCFGYAAIGVCQGVLALSLCICGLLLQLRAHRGGTWYGVLRTRGRLLCGE